MTSNIVKSVNAMFDVEREFPIVAIFDEINRRFALLFHQRRMELVNSANKFVPSIGKDISKYVNAGNKLLAHQIANYKFSVTGHGDVAIVDLQRRNCTCRISIWTKYLVHMPWQRFYPNMVLILEIRLHVLLFILFSRKIHNGILSKNSLSAN